MVKRLNATSYVPAPLVQGGSTADKQENGRPSKRARILEDSGGGREPVEKAKANWASLPVELEGKIFRDLIDPNDIRSTLRNLTAFKGTSKSLKEIVGHELYDPKFVELISAIMAENNEMLDSFSNYYVADNIANYRLNNMKLEADFIPLRTADERSLTVNYILNHKNGRAIKGAMRSLIRNIDYTKSKEKIRIVKYVCVDNIEDDIAKDLASELIEKAEHLEPKECSSLAKKSCHIQRCEEDEWHGLECWAPKMGLLDDKDQEEILSHGIYAGKPFFEHFAKHIDKVSKVNRPKIVAEIVKLPASHPGKFEALSYLARHLDCIDISDRPRVISSILDNFGKGSEQSVDEHRWYSKPEFCEIEAIHFLLTHKKFLSFPEQDRVCDFIDTAISKSTPAAYAAKSQLITHMRAEERLNFFKAALDQNDEGVKEAVVYGLTARIEDLDEHERSEYISCITHLSDEDSFSDEIGIYIIRNNLEVLDEYQRSALIKRQCIVIMESGEPSYTVGFKYIADNAKHLDIKDIRRSIKAARRVVNEYIDGGYPIEAGANASSIRSCSGYAARCLANWAREAATKATVHEEDAVSYEDQLNRTADVNQHAEVAIPRSYDERSRESSVER